MIEQLLAFCIVQTQTPQIPALALDGEKQCVLEYLFNVASRIGIHFGSVIDSSILDRVEMVIRSFPAKASSLIGTAQGLVVLK